MRHERAGTFVRHAHTFAPVAIDLGLRTTADAWVYPAGYQINAISLASKCNALARAEFDQWARHKRDVKARPAL